MIIGSGFGGAMAAYPLVEAGWRVLILERGEWVERGPHNWDPSGARDLNRYFTTDTLYHVRGDHDEKAGAFRCVGGPSVFYGGVAVRFRERDFEGYGEIVAGTGARWPYRYRDIEPYYDLAERLIGVAGRSGEDPTEPPRRNGYPQTAPAFSATSRLIGEAAAGLGLRPFHLPLAINYGNGGGRSACIACATCDGFACAVEAKNDLATTLIPHLLRRGLQLESEVVVTRLEEAGGRIRAVHARSRRTGEARVYHAREVVLAAGALASPHLLLASGLDARNPAGHLVGRFLMRHCNGIQLGLFRTRPDPEGTFHKQVGIHDYYFGHPSVSSPAGRLGGIQQLHVPPIGLVQANVPGRLKDVVRPFLEHVTGLLCIAEDQPRYGNRVTIDARRLDRFGLPLPVVTHRYTDRDLAARRALLDRSRDVLRAAGAILTRVHKVRTFSHAVGTVRMGDDPATAPLDAFGRFRGVDNLRVVDGSVMPTSAAVNPSLTIAANALRCAEELAGVSILDDPPA